MEKENLKNTCINLIEKTLERAKILQNAIEENKILRNEIKKENEIVRNEILINNLIKDIIAGMGLFIYLVSKDTVEI